MQKASRMVLGIASTSQTKHRESRCMADSARAPRSPTPSRVDRLERAPALAHAPSVRHALSASIPPISAAPPRPGPAHRCARYRSID